MKIIVVGSNAAGMSFAAKYKRNNPDHEIIAFEERDYVSFGSCGLPYYVGGFFDDSKEFFARSVEDTIKSGIDLRINSKVTAIDFDSKEITVNDSDTYSYDKLIISTGASPIVPNFGDFNKDKFSTMTSFEDGEKTKPILQSEDIEHVTIIGGGFIGVELIEACKKLGKKVTLVEGTYSVLSNQFEKEITDIATEEITSHDVELITDAFVENISDHEGGYLVKTSTGSFKTDFIYCSVGFRPNTEFINLDKLKNGAIITDENCMTNVKDVYAIGDCATSYNSITKKSQFVPLATVANKYGRMLADHLSCNNTFMDGMLGTSCLKVMDLEMARTGLSEKEIIAEGYNYKKVIIKDKNHTSYYPGQDDLLVVMFYDLDTKLILGCQMIGVDGVVGRINTIAACISGNITTNQLGYLDLAYAPPFARTWDILNVTGNVAK